jgi:hypothetical protein
MTDTETADAVTTTIPKPEGQAWRSRIIGHGTERPDQLLAHPENWRIHSKRQQTALGEMLDTVGWVQSVIVNQATGHVLDGHLRVGLAISRSEAEIPVGYVDLTEAEERLVLAAMDPIAAMAATDSAALMGLVSNVDAPAELEAMIRATAGMDAGSSATVTDEQVEDRQREMDRQFGDTSSGATDAITDVTCPECGHEFGVTI